MKTSTFDIPGLLGLTALVAVLALGAGSSANAACSALTDKYINSFSILKKIKADIGDCSNPDEAKQFAKIIREVGCPDKAHGAKAVASCKSDVQMVHDQLCGNDKFTDKFIADRPVLSRFTEKLGNCSDRDQAEKLLKLHQGLCWNYAKGSTKALKEDDRIYCETDLRYLCYRTCSSRLPTDKAPHLSNPINPIDKLPHTTGRPDKDVPGGRL